MLAYSKGSLLLSKLNLSVPHNISTFDNYVIVKIIYCLQS